MSSFYDSNTYNKDFKHPEKNQIIKHAGHEWWSQVVQVPISRNTSICNLVKSRIIINQAIMRSGALQPWLNP